MYRSQKLEAMDENIEEDGESRSKIKSARSSSASAEQCPLIGNLVRCGYIESAGQRRIYKEGSLHKYL